MGIAFVDPPRPDTPTLVGPQFVTLEYAAKFFALLGEWNDGSREDDEDNICFSFVFESEGWYSCYLYPNMRRARPKAFFDEAARLKPGRKHDGLVMQLTFCKAFAYTPQSLVYRFVREHDGSRPIWLQAFLSNPTRIAHDVAPILKWGVQVKRRDSLTKEDFEYQYLRQGTKPLR
jgi:hypothetical protein